VLVKVGPVPLGHLTDPGHVIVLAVPSAVRIKVNPCTELALDSVLLIVRVEMLEFRDTVNTCAAFRSSVRELDDIVGADLRSE
jgi:hypothetical protein